MDRPFYAVPVIRLAILGTLCTIGMLVLRLPYAPMAGTLVSVTSLIPLPQNVNQEPRNQDQIDWGNHMKPQKSKKMITILKTLPLLICIVIIVLFLASGNDITVQTVLSYTPESPFAAAMVILLFYALKSVSFVFPIAILQIAAGHLFPTPAALFINFLGRAITLSIPYWIGRFSGSDVINSLQEKYPKIKEIFDRQGRNPVFISFLLRTFCFLPGDAVSLYLGAAGIPFPYYLAGGILGTAPGVVLATLLGSSITEPGSPAFWLSASLMAFMAVISVITYLHNNSS